VQPLKLVPKEKQVKKKDEKKRESYIEGKVKDRARDIGFWVRKFVSPGHKSSPDDIFVEHKNGKIVRWFFIEFKATGEAETLAQHDCHVEMREAGMTVYVVDNVEDGYAILEGIA
jgi:hypothetical protein